MALEIDLPKFKDYNVERLISFVYNTYDQRGRSLNYTNYKLTEINLSAKWKLYLKKLIEWPKQGQVVAHILYFYTLKT